MLLLAIRLLKPMMLRYPLIYGMGGSKLLLLRVLVQVWTAAENWN
jgi:hypothetical protein